MTRRWCALEASDGSLSATVRQHGEADMLREATDMDLKLFLTIFATIFVAELGDKTQVATLLYASDSSHPRLTVFVASAAALILTSAIAVLAGSVVSQYVSPGALRWIAGLGFIAVGLWVLLAGE